jgi:malate dehydrogenase
MRAFSILRKTNVRCFSSSSGPKVSVVGAAGGIGQPLSLLLKQSPLVGRLGLYDLAPFTPGVGVDLSHINSPAKVEAFAGDDAEMEKALAGSDVIVIPAGVPRKEGMTRDDLFNINAGIVANITRVSAKVAPGAKLCIISNPVNSTVPIAAEILKRLDAYDPNKVFGVTTLDVCRANTFVSENQNLDVNTTNVTVVGGHAGKTILPLLSQVEGANFTQEDKEALTHRIMFGGDEVVKAKAGHGSATLSMAFAGANFALQVLRAAAGEQGIVECSYVQSDVVPELPFFSTPVELGVDGVKKIHGTGPMDDFEKKLFEEMVPELKASIDKGVEFAKNYEL